MCQVFKLIRPSQDPALLLGFPNKTAPKTQNAQDWNSRLYDAPPAVTTQHSQIKLQPKPKQQQKALYPENPSYKHKQETGKLLSLVKFDCIQSAWHTKPRPHTSRTPATEANTLNPLRNHITDTSTSNQRNPHQVAHKTQVFTPSDSAGFINAVSGVLTTPVQTPKAPSIRFYMSDKADAQNNYTLAKHGFDMT